MYRHMFAAMTLVTFCGCAPSEPATPAQSLPPVMARAAGPAVDRLTGPVIQDASLERSPLATVAELRARQGDQALLRDEPAALAFQRIRDAFQRGEQDALTLPVYRLEAPVADLLGHIRARAAFFGLKPTEMRWRETAGPGDGDRFDRANPPADVEFLSVQDGAYELRLNRQSGSELLIDGSRFHHGEDVLPELVLPDSEYVSRAAAYVERVFGARVDGLELYPYKLRHYKNASAELGEAPQVTVYQVAVAFNATVHGVPVIGAGSKVAVHMTPDGQVISHESSLRRLDAPLGSFTGRELRSPEAAEAEVRAMLADQGVLLDQYRLARTEFGYFRLGRSSVQGLVAPHYVFSFHPLDGKLGKKRTEAVPATTNPRLLELIALDRLAETDRKEGLMAEARPLHEK